MTIQCTSLFMYISEGMSSQRNSYQSTFGSPGGNYSASAEAKQFEQSFKCIFCHQDFTGVAELRSHISDIHPDTNEMPYNCSLCGKGYLSSSGMYRHMKIHKGEYIKCSVCDKKFAQKFNLKLHLKRVHDSDICFSCMQVYQKNAAYVHICT